MSTQLKELFEGSELSTEIQEKVSTMFESAVEVRVAQMIEEKESFYEEKAKEYQDYVIAEMEDKVEEYIESELVPVVEKYLDYSVNEYIAENKVAIESGIKVALAEQFLGGMKTVAEQFNVIVPEGQDDLIKEMEQKVETIQARFDRVLDEKAEVERELQESKMASIVDSKVGELTESQKEKFCKAAAKVSFKDEDQYGSAIDDLYESYFPSESDKADLIEEKEAETLTESKSTHPSYIDQILSRI